MEIEKQEKTQAMLIQWIQKYSQISFPSDYKKLTERTKSVFKYTSNDMCTVLYRSHLLEDVVLKCIHQLTVEPNFIELKNGLLELPYQVGGNYCDRDP